MEQAKMEQPICPNPKCKAVDSLVLVKPEMFYLCGDCNEEFELDEIEGTQK